ncbi:MAG: alanine--tRNA ligase [Candidatus Neomarinimicrobiota bacterium]
MKSSQEIRQDFISFFEDKGHRFVRSSPVVPIDDPTLLFTNAGMNQFKPIFLGERKPEFPRAVNSQKCIRVSGKHNDLEEVGIDTYHHTFFEMLGNWSFGDYYKAEAIQWAWELLTEHWGMAKERLWATVYETDDEAAELWPQMTGIPAERVLRFGAKENFWEMGETGPCGPCSEIHYFTGPDLTTMSAEGVNADPAYQELWNLVFIQNLRLKDGSLEDLPEKHVDTGAGLERIVAVLQGQDSNYGTDLFTPLIKHIEEVTGVPYEEDGGTAHRVVADHTRMLAFSLADGALPSNEGRGYVLRRILRRGARFGRMLGQEQPFMHTLVAPLVAQMGAAYPELVEKRTHIEKVIQAEEAAFGETLDRGLEIFAKITAGMQAGEVIPGEEAFRLYDTYGFPLDLTELMAREKELSVDTDGFETAMAKQRKRARKGGKAKGAVGGEKWTVASEGTSSDFVGFGTMESEAVIRQYRAREDGTVSVILDRTPFYAESGGQVGDTGTIRGEGLELDVQDTQKQAVNGKDEIVHSGVLKQGSLEGKSKVKASADRERRQSIRLNHTATHLLHKALKVELGEHVQQSGSLVAPDRLRFDFTHYEKLTDEQIEAIEVLVNRVIRENHEVGTELMSYEDARASGAVAMFGEKYADEVRVLDVPGFSRELCGGTHASRTGDIGLFKITSETALASGVRRMEALTGELAVARVQSQAATLGQLSRHFQTSAAELPAKAEQMQERLKELARQLKQATRQKSRDRVGELAAKAEETNGLRLVVQLVGAVNEIDQLKDLAVDVKHRLKSAVVVLYAEMEQKAKAVVAVTDDLKARLPAGELAKQIGELLGGGGGGSPIMATAGGEDVAVMDGAVAGTAEIITSRLGKAK